MIDEKGLESLEPYFCAPENIENDRAKRVLTLVANDAYTGAKLTQTARDGIEREVVILDIEVPLGQRDTVHDIRSVEHVAIEFYNNDLLPSVFPLRQDFPATPHLNTAPKGNPRSLCLYDEAWSEERLRWTALDFIERVRLWFERTAYDVLHADDQPLDPFLLGGSIFTLIVPPSLLSPDFHGEFVVSSVTHEKRRDIYFLEDGKLPRRDGRCETALAMSISTPPRLHGILHYAPSTLKELIELDDEIGSVIRNELIRDVKRYYSDDPGALDKKLLILLEIPLQRHPDSLPESRTHNAFMLEKSIGEVGEALGVLIGAPEVNGYRWGLSMDNVEPELSTIRLEAGDVRLGFSPKHAAAASGTETSISRIVLIGAGALGSQLALALSREGFGTWTIVDNDILFPHNLARHALSGAMVGHTKASSVAWVINDLHDGGNVAEYIECDVLSPRDELERLIDALANADLIIDASASVAVARFLSHESERRAPVLSLFFNPEGTDLVALFEGQDRNCQLDNIEIEYYRELLTNEALHNHLNPPKGKIRQSTSCRVPSVQIPQNRIIRLVGRAAEIVRQCQHMREAKALIWRDTGNSTEIGLDVHPIPAAFCEIENWRVVCLDAPRDYLKNQRANSPNIETGGVLVGLWDRENKHVYVCEATGPPSDSAQEHSGFIRGVAGLELKLNRLSNITANNIGYVGEWHTHPSGHPSNLSGDDKRFLEQMKMKTRLEDSPALMFVVGEDGVRVAILDQEGSEISSKLLEG